MERDMLEQCGYDYDYKEPTAAECYLSCIHRNACKRLHGIMAPGESSEFDSIGGNLNCGDCFEYEEDKRVCL